MAHELSRKEDRAAARARRLDLDGRSTTWATSRPRWPAPSSCREVARLVKGRKVKEGVQLWVQTDTPSYFMAQHYGDTKAIEDAGGKIYHQTCMAMTPFRHYPKNITIATSSFKYTKLCAGFGSEGTTWIYANPEALVDAAVTGVFKPTARWDFWSQPRENRLASEKDKPLYDGGRPMVS